MCSSSASSVLPSLPAVVSVAEAVDSWRLISETNFLECPAVENVEKSKPGMGAASRNPMGTFISNVADSSAMPDDKMVAGGCLMAGDAVNVAKLNPDHTGREAGATSASAAFDGVRGVHSVFESEKTRDCTPFEKMLKSNDMSAQLVVVYTRRHKAVSAKYCHSFSAPIAENGIHATEINDSYTHEAIHLSWMPVSEVGAEKIVEKARTWKEGN